VREKQVEIQLDLGAIAPDLIAVQGNKGYADWGAGLISEIQNDISMSSNDGITVTIRKVPLRPSSSKNALLAIGGLVLGITAVSGSLDLGKVTRTINGIWQAVRKMLPKGTIVRIKSGTDVIDISTDSEEAARSLLKVSSDVLNRLQSSKSASSPKTKLAVTLSPQRR
jgi:gas vesicle protein